MPILYKNMMINIWGREMGGGANSREGGGGGHASSKGPEGIVISPAPPA